MKQVLSNQKEVCHFWANKLQSQGRAGSMFFENERIYSYGYHFEIARFVKDSVVIFTNRSYSSTTAKHKSYTRQSIPYSVKVFTLPSFTDHKGNVEFMLKTIEDKFEEAARSRKYTESILESVVNSTKQIEDYCNEFKLKLNKTQLALVERAKNCLNEDQLQDIRTKLAERSKKLLDSKRKEINEWLSCQRESLSNSINKVFLRTKCNAPEIVETSLGANVPLNEAKSLYLALKNNVPVNGFQIGHYYVNSYSNAVLTIGCHKLTQDEINRFASLQNWN